MKNWKETDKQKKQMRKEHKTTVTLVIAGICLLAGRSVVAAETKDLTLEVTEKMDDEAVAADVPEEETQKSFPVIPVVIVVLVIAAVAAVKETQKETTGRKRRGGITG